MASFWGRCVGDLMQCDLEPCNFYTIRASASLVRPSSSGIVCRPVSDRLIIKAARIIASPLSDDPCSPARALRPLSDIASSCERVRTLSRLCARWPISATRSFVVALMLPRHTEPPNLLGFSTPPRLKLDAPCMLGLPTPEAPCRLNAKRSLSSVFVWGREGSEGGGWVNGKHIETISK